jgi:radical SAM protein with 4Fe4S-binding SPASM domain
MSLSKSLQRNPATAREFARCVQENRPYRLLDMKIYLTRRCNLRCVMCNAWTEQDGRDELDTGDWLRVVAQAKSLGLTNLKLFGGEPTLRPDLAAIVGHAARLGIRCALVTNGTLLTEEHAHALVKAGLAELDLSLDASTPALHDSIRGAPGAWQRAMRGLQAMQQAAQSLARRLFVRVNIVVMRENYRDMPGLASALSALAVDEIVLNPVIPRKDHPHALLREDILEYNAEVAPRIVEQSASYRLSKNCDDVYLYGTGEQDIEKAVQCRYVDRLKVRYCFKPWYYMVVRENGDVVGCNTVKHPMARLGNVRQAPVEGIWLSEGYETFRASCKPPRFDDCASCCYHFALVNRQISKIVKPG